MIFVIVGGVVEFDFSRILKILDEIVEENIINSSEIVAQIGHSKYVPMNYRNFRFVDGDEFQKYIDDSKLIITHGGVGTLISAMKKNKKIISFPRLAKYNEHLDDHQLELTTILKNDGYIKMATDKKELIKVLNEIKNFEPKEFISDNSYMSKIIIDFIEKI